MDDCELLEWVLSACSQSQVMKRTKKKNLYADYLKGHSLKENLSFHLSFPLFLYH